MKKSTKIIIERLINPLPISKGAVIAYITTKIALNISLNQLNLTLNSFPVNHMGKIYINGSSKTFLLHNFLFTNFS